MDFRFEEFLWLHRPHHWIFLISKSIYQFLILILPILNSALGFIQLCSVLFDLVCFLVLGRFPVLFELVLCAFLNYGPPPGHFIQLDIHEVENTILKVNIFAHLNLRTRKTRVGVQLLESQWCVHLLSPCFLISSQVHNALPQTVVRCAFHFKDAPADQITISLLFIIFY